MPWLPTVCPSDIVTQTVLLKLNVFLSFGGSSSPTDLPIIKWCFSMGRYHLCTAKQLRPSHRTLTVRQRPGARGGRGDITIATFLLPTSTIRSTIP